MNESPNESPLMLSISGLRGVIGGSLTPLVATRYAAAFGQWLKTQSPNHAQPPHIVLGRDSRPSGQMIEMAATAGLIGVGCRVTSLGVVTTPSVALMIGQLQADGGLVITASHNPIIWNGIKALRHDGVAPPPQQAKDIIAHFNRDQTGYAPVEQLQAIEQNTQTHKIHVERVLAQIDVEAIRARRLKVVLDSVHGAGGPAAAMLLNQLGVELTHLYAQPTGQFPHTPEPTRENLTELCDAVRQHEADIGFAQDPDADRLAIVDEQGSYIGEEYTLALTSLHVLNQLQDTRDAVLVANLSTSRMIDDIAAKAGARVVRTPVGEANVAAAIRANQGVLGGEGNGGVIWPKICSVRDSITGIALILELLAKNKQRPLSAVVDQIPRYAIVKSKADVSVDMLLRYAQILQDHFAKQKLDLQDGVRIDWPDRWVHVRPSNTEPIVRIIAEANNPAQAQQLIDETRQVLGVA